MVKSRIRIMYAQKIPEYQQQLILCKNIIAISLLAITKEELWMFYYFIFYDHPF